MSLLSIFVNYTILWHVISRYFRSALLYRRLHASDITFCTSLGCIIESRSMKRP